MKKTSIGVAELLIDTDVNALEKEHEGLYNLFGDPLSRVELRLDGGHGRATLTAPPTAGDYVIKVLVSDGTGAAAVGHVAVHVGAPPAR